MLWGRKVWRTPDDAVREATGLPVGSARANDYSVVRTSGSSDVADVLNDAKSQVIAVLGQFTEDEQALLVFYAHRFAYRDIARGLRMRKATAIQRHRRARERLLQRLRQLKLVDGD